MRRTRALRPQAIAVLILTALSYVSSYSKSYLMCKRPDAQTCHIWILSAKNVHQNFEEMFTFANSRATCIVTKALPVSTHRTLISGDSANHPKKTSIYCESFKIMGEFYDLNEDVFRANNAARVRRQSEYTPRGRYRGQTQSQYLAIDHGNNKDEGKAEAHSAADSSRASVSGNSGMGQAQSQSIFDSSCDDCYGKSDSLADNLKRRPYFPDVPRGGDDRANQPNWQDGVKNGGLSPNGDSGGIRRPGQSGLTDYIPGQTYGTNQGPGSLGTGGMPGTSFYQPGRGYTNGNQNIGPANKLPGSNQPGLNVPNQLNLPTGQSFNRDSGPSGNGQGIPGGGQTYGPGGVLSPNGYRPDDSMRGYNREFTPGRSGFIPGQGADKSYSPTQNNFRPNNGGGYIPTDGSLTGLNNLGPSSGSSNLYGPNQPINPNQVLGRGQVKPSDVNGAYVPGLTGREGYGPGVSNGNGIPIAGDGYKPGQTGLNDGRYPLNKIGMSGPQQGMLPGLQSERAGPNQLGSPGTNWPLASGPYQGPGGSSVYCCVVPNSGQTSSTYPNSYGTGSNSLIPNNLVSPGQYGQGRQNTPSSLGGQNIPSGPGGPGGQYSPGGLGGQHIPGGSAGQYSPGGLGGQNIPGGSGGQYSPGGLGGQNVPGGSGGQYSPGGLGGQNIPGGSGGQYSPGGLGGQNIPGGPGGQYSPGGLGGQNIPGGSGGQYSPGGLGGQKIPGGSGGQYSPGGLGGQNIPGGSGGQYSPGGFGGQNIPGGSGGPYSPGGLGGQNIPGGSGGQYGPGNSGGQNIPGSSGGQNIPGGPGGQYSPVGSSGQSILGGPGGQYSPGGSGGQNIPGGSGGGYSPGGSRGQNIPGAPGRQYGPGGLGQNIPGGSGGQYSPSGLGGQNIPGGLSGQYSPGGLGGQNIPGGSSGQYSPGDAGGQTIPDGQGGPHIPGGPGGQYVPGSFGGQLTPGSSVGQNVPGGSAGQYIPAGSGQNIPGGTEGQDALGVPGGTYERPDNYRQRPGQNEPTGQYGIGTNVGSQGGQYDTGSTNGAKGPSGPYGAGGSGNLPQGVGTSQGNYGQVNGNEQTPGSNGYYPVGQVGGAGGQQPYGPGYYPPGGGPAGQSGKGPYGYYNQGATGLDKDNDIPQNYVNPNSIAPEDDDSEAEASVAQAANGTTASASSKGGNSKERAQANVHGTYTGSGSFQAQAQITGDNKGAESEVSGGKKGASSSAAGNGRNNKSQANVQLGSETGSVQTQSQSNGVMHSSNSQVQGSVKGGMADAQARGPGSTSSQAQIGFTPYKDRDKAAHDSQGTPFVGGGLASAQSSGRTGQSQSQLHGTFRYGITYNGAAQSGASLDKDAIFPNRLSFDKIDVFDDDEKLINTTNITEEPESLETDNTPKGIPSLPVPFDTKVIDPPITTENIVDETVKYSESEYSSHTHSDHHKSDEDVTSGPPVLSNKSFPGSNYGSNNADYDFTTDRDENQPEDYDTDAGFGPDGNEAVVEQGEYSNYDEYTKDPQTHQSLQSPSHKGVEIKQTTGGNTQHILLDSLKNQDAEITQRNSERPDESRIYQPGERVPGTGGYTIPLGFTGSVKSVASKDKTYVVGSKSSPSQAQTVTLTPGTGRINYNHPYSYGRNVKPKDLRNLSSANDNDNRYVSVSKSVTRALDDENNIKKQYSHTYYTKSSSCGYFTFTCTMVSSAEGRKKVCKPKIPTNPDGTPIRC